MSQRALIHFVSTFLICVASFTTQIHAQRFPKGVFEQPLADWQTKEAKQYLLRDQQLQNSELSMQLNDASLHAVEVTSLDKAFAVGDRGVILVTVDGGRNWKRQESGVTVRLSDVYFADDLNGIVVGGFMHYKAKASVGVVLKTNNGGRTWTRVETPMLPALRGVQELATGELFAWGDMSISSLTSLFISKDGGRTWNAASDFASLTHLQSAAFYDSSHGVVVDRYGRVFAVNNQQSIRLALPIDTPPIRKAHFDGSRIWLIGSNGSVFKEEKARPGQTVERAIGDFKRLSLPGSRADHELIELDAICTHGDRVTVAGTPGSVVWTSDNHGENWSVHKTRQKIPINAMSNHLKDRLVFATDLLNLHGSRNGGVAWRRENNGPTRFRILNVAGTQDSVAWLSLSQSAWGNTETAALVTVHDSNFHLGTAVEPDSASRFDFIANDLGLGRADLWTAFPTNYRGTVLRSADGENWYQSEKRMQLISRRITSVIRHLRPDVVICESLADRDQLLSRCGSTALDAIRKSADTSTILFSQESGIPNVPWQVDRVFARATRNKSDVNLNANAPMNGTGKILGDVADVAFQALDIEPGNESLLLLSADKIRSGQKIDLFSKMLKQADTHRQTELQRLNNLEVLIGRASREELIAEIVSMRGDGTLKDIRWRAKYRSLIEQTTLSKRAAANLQLAVESLNQSKFNRWQFALQQIKADHFAQDEYRCALAVVANIAASQEFQYWRSKSVYAGEKNNATNDSAPGPVLQQFANSHSTDLSSSQLDEQRRSFDRRAILNISENSNTERPITPFGSVKVPSTEANNSVVPAAFTTVESIDPQIDSSELKASKLSNRFNETANFFESFLANSSPIHKNYFQDLRFQLAKQIYLNGQHTAAKFQSNSSQGQPSTSDSPLESFRFPEITFGWMNAKRKSNNIAESSHGNVPSNFDLVAVKTKHRPHLDGRLDDATWENATAYQMLDKQRPAESGSTCFFAHDDDYLYIAVSGPVANKTQNPSDQVSLFIDVDRDWSTRYELTVDAEGIATDALESTAIEKKIDGWDAQWYFASNTSETNWNIEFAIPIAELTPEEVDQALWGFELRRTVTDSACHCLSGDFTDGDTMLNQLLLQFR